MKTKKPVAPKRKSGKKLARHNAQRLITAATKGRVSEIRSLLAKGVSIDVRDSNGLTALMAAVIAGQEKMARFLISSGADVNAVDEDALRGGDLYGMTPLKLAAENGNIRLLRILLGKGADINHDLTTRRHTALGMAAKNGHLAPMRLLIRTGAIIEDNALYSPVAGGHLHIVQDLIKRGANVNYVNGLGEPVLMTAVVRGHRAIAELLLERGADINATQAGQTCLMRSIHKGSTDFALWLIKRGADIHVKDFGQRTALWFAAKLGNERVVKALLQKDAEVDVADVNGDTPLIVAKREGLKTIEGMLEQRR